MVRKYVILVGTLLLLGPPPRCLAIENPTLEVRVSVDLTPDVGQPFGTLWEAVDENGKPRAGGGFLNAYNTQDRSDRRLLHVYVRTAGEKDFAPEKLPRPSADSGTYLFGFNGRLFAKARGGIDQKLRQWRPDENRWKVDDSTTPFSVHVADNVLAATRQRITFGERTILELTPNEGSITEWYYASSHLIMRHSNPQMDPPVNDLVGFSWRPSTVDGLSMEDGRRISLSQPREFIYAFGPKAGNIVTASNMGSVHQFDGHAWKTVRFPDGTSFQIYSTLNTSDRLLLGQYPTGELFEYVDGDLRQLHGWPPVMEGVSPHAREAQTLAIYGGDIFAGVWPWGEVWRFDRSAKRWSFLGRMFTHPEPTDLTTHPYEAETKELDAVFNRWGQRVTSMVPMGDSLYIATSSKGGQPYDSKFKFLSRDQRLEYGAVYRYRQPGCLAVPIAWKEGSSTFSFRLTTSSIEVDQGGRRLGQAAWDEKHPARLDRLRVEMGSGVFGPTTGKIVDAASSTSSASTP